MMPKFRAWHIEKKRYYNVEMLAFGLPECVFVKGDNGGLRLDFDEVVLEQYTGLKDKNGVEIYRNDIVRYLLPRGHKIYFEVFFDKGCYAAKSKNGDIFLLSGFELSNDIDVIGNIHENGELLK